MNFVTKLRAVTLGAAHDLLDKAVDLNSPSVVRQYVRDLEAALDKLKSESAIQDGTLRTQLREQSDLQSSIESDKATISKLLASTDPTGKALATAKANLVITKQQHLAEIADAITNQQNVAIGMKNAVISLESKHDQMVARVRELERLDRESKAKESAASAITNAGRIISDIDSPSVDDLADRMHRRNDVASAKFDQAVGGLHTEEPNSDDVAALLASLAPVETAAK